MTSEILKGIAIAGLVLNSVASSACIPFGDELVSINHFPTPGAEVISIEHCPVEDIATTILQCAALDTDDSGVTPLSIEEHSAWFATTH